MVPKFIVYSYHLIEDDVNNEANQQAKEQAHEDIARIMKSEINTRITAKDGPSVKGNGYDTVA